MARARSKQTMGRRLTGVVGCVLLASAFGQGCAYPSHRWGYDRQLLAADRMADHGDYEGARAAYESLAWETVREDDLRYVRYRLAYLYELQGEFAQAIEAYSAIAADPGAAVDQYPAQALYRVGRIQLDELGEIDSAFNTWDRAILTFPNSDFSEDSMTSILRIWRSEANRDALLGWLSERSSQLARTEIGDNLLYWTARVLVDEFADYETALPLFVRVYTDYSRGGLWDDAMWHAAGCLGSLQRIDDEYTLLESFIDRREVSLMVADYDSSWYNDALYRMAEIHEQRGDTDGAVAVWSRFMATFPLSIEADDVAFHIMELEAPRCGRATMNDWLAYLNEEHPESRHLDDATALVASCGGAR